MTRPLTTRRSAPVARDRAPRVTAPKGAQGRVWRACPGRDRQTRLPISGSAQTSGGGILGLWAAGQPALGQPALGQRVLGLLASGLLALGVLAGCGREAPPEPPVGIWSEGERALIDSLSPIPPLPPSPGNAVADDPGARALGHALFFEPALSANGHISCASCHVPDKYFTDGLPLARAIGTTQRHTPTIIGAQWAPFLFWDGRRDSLWAQALGPLENEVEHGFDRVAVARVVFERYKAPYEAIFGPMPDMSDRATFPEHGRPLEFNTNHPHNMAWAALTPGDQEAVNRVVANVGKAIEAYERALLPGPAPFDRYVEALKAGDAEGGGHLSDAALRGLRAFVGKGQCVNCHNGPLLSDLGFHNLGLPPTGDGSFADVGRSLGAAQVKMDAFRCGEPFSDARQCEELRFLNHTFDDFLGAFKTPSLRNVAMTAPYMHTGQFATLDDVVNFYRTLPSKAAVGHRELVLDLLDPAVDTQDLVAFLESLTGPLPDPQWRSPPSKEQP